jgi:3-isopropylmalate/(R)-2-methylmalate dehydratase small subunit
MSVISGRTWVFGDGIDTDIIIPARYLVLPLGEMKWKAMEPARADFAESVAPGDIVVGGRNFGCGSSREQAPAVLKALGVRAIVAESFARIFYRNAINLGLPVVECPGIAAAATEGEVISVDVTEGEVLVESSGRRLAGSKLPEFLLKIISDGGLIEHLLARGGATP